MRMDQLFFAKSLSYWGQAVAKSLSGPPPDLLAGRVFSCHMALLLRRSDIEVSGWLCLSCTRLGALHTHIHPNVGKAQPVVPEVQVTQGLRRDAILDTSRIHCCVC